MKTKQLFLFAILLSANTFAITPKDQTITSKENVWNGKHCAVSLTYDDALPGHLDRVIPVLDSLGFKGTFYISCNSGTLNNRINDWRKAATNGHELGNHTLFHPCIAKMKDRDYSSWVAPEYDMGNYSIKRIVDEINMANTLLKAIDGKSKRTIAYPCGDCVLRDTSYIPYIKSSFVGGRNGAGSSLKIEDISVYQINAVGIGDNYSSEMLIDLVKKAQETGTLVVFLFHGVGGGHNANVAMNKHNDLVKYIKQNEKEIWVAPMVDIAEFVTNYQNKMQKK
jgi:peptidoglycan/xylan/chitin deacetylase (PgdA/CDA1 family)